ncbi:beta/alpha barrel domain-containing protein [Leucobacter tenebrionis]|uniref:hypothetical protein n=1 Tax=Leucobacter tenebrionis TaxID=2873270 RepID=UPI001CA6D471|nr:hypothetical protein [Leucobacter tenebrionis]QZY52958.1 hypothetical protein KVY00_05855 [Leucobacter tenebrionis]
MIRVAASLWSVAPPELESVSRRLVDDGLARFHWDHADGTIGPAGGFTPAEARRLGAGAAAEAHLMHRDPRPAIAEWAEFCDAVAVHVSEPHWRECFGLIRGHGALPVAAVSSFDELRAAADAEDPLASGALVMTIRPGHAGSAFDPASYDLVAEASRLGFGRVGVDGSVTEERAARLVDRGANWIVSGTSLVGADDRAAWIANVQGRSGQRAG